MASGTLTGAPTPPAHISSSQLGTSHLRHVHFLCRDNANRLFCSIIGDLLMRRESDTRESHLQYAPQALRLSCLKLWRSSAEPLQCSSARQCTQHA